MLSATGFLAGCRMEATITVVPNGATPQFVVTYDRGKTACVQGLTVRLAGSGARGDVWAVRRGDGATCADRMRYGIAPAGYVTVTPARPLSAQRDYEVAASGAGWSDVKPLRIP